ncbi:NUDIX hydrolase 8-like protein [Tanacetum coccineum]
MILLLWSMLVQSSRGHDGCLDPRCLLGLALGHMNLSMDDMVSIMYDVLVIKVLATCSLEAACLNSRNSQVITQAVAKYPYRYDNATNTPISNVKRNMAKVATKKCDLVPIAVKEGFRYHHAEAGYVMMTYWIPDEPCMLPANASHQVGVGGFVLNDKNEVLVVQEKHCAPELVDLWKLPIGFILESKEIFTGGVREVKEETWIETEFLEVIAFRYICSREYYGEQSFISIFSSEIKIDDLEVQAAKIEKRENGMWEVEGSSSREKREVRMIERAWKLCGGGCGMGEMYGGFDWRLID